MSEDMNENINEEKKAKLDDPGGINPDELDIVFAPSFTESMQNIPEDERDEIWEEIQSALNELQTNPYAGTPMFGGPLAVFWNFIKRHLYRVGIRF